MSKIVWYILAASVFVAIIIMFVSFFVMKAKIKKVKESANLIETDVDNPALLRDNYGELLWDEKKKVQFPTGDKSLELIINSAYRNKYKTFNTYALSGKYVEKSLIELAKIKKDTKAFDLAVVKFDAETIEKVDSYMKKLNDKGMIFIVSAGDKKLVKQLTSYLKLTGIRHEFQKVDSGIILIAK